MRIDGPGKTSSTSNSSKTKKSKGAGGTSFSALVDSMNAGAETSESADVAATSSVGVVDALLAVQEDGARGSKEANARMEQRAEDILNQLDNVKNSILTGDVSEAELQQISNLIASKRDQDIDPMLSELLDEIDLRAQVELAKMGKI